MHQLSKLLFLALILWTSALAAQTEQFIASKITHATVFLEGAQVSRMAKVSAATGKNQLVFTGLTAEMDPKSIQIKADDEDLTVLSVSHRLKFNERPKENPEADNIYDQIDQLDEQKALLSTRYRILKEEEDILALNRVVASPQTGLDAQDLVEAVNFHRERITHIRLRQLAISRSLDSLKDQRALLQQQLAEAGKTEEVKTTAEVVVITQNKSATKSDFVITYLVPNARWVPHYDVRVADISQPVDLRYRARVSQNSGEDWAGVRLKLSTGDPSANAIAPTLPMWRLGYNNRPPVYRPGAKAQVQTGFRKLHGKVTDETGEPLIGVTILVPGTEIGTVTDFDGQYYLEAPASATQLQVSYLGFSQQLVNVSTGLMTTRLQAETELLDEVVVTGYGSNRAKKSRGRRAARSAAPRAAPSAPVPVQTQRRATTVNFDIELPYDIPSDGKAREVEIKRHTLPATYTHYAVPKFSLDAFLTASVTDWEQYDLLSGDINLFFEGTYLGESRLNVETVADTLKLSLGRDPGVVIERKATEDYRKRNFFGNKKTDSRGYTISVRNKKDQPIQFTIKDQVPVSGNEDIEIKTDIPRVLRLDERTGILTAKLIVQPKGEHSMQFGYTVKYPNHQTVNLE
ncbi:DUF4139 domain-containing protein [Neolewinella agarilytica]|uniref:DUF4139 domain-containing protein n=1 Tax=Neolewinella agarilytica TaxID=478744 RepID=UPI002357B006|nr:DUF4139 domain-containing protein [Neolewinella agarilytica]